MRNEHIAVLMIPVALLTWLAHTVIWLPLAALGLVVCFVLARTQAWHQVRSNRLDQRPISAWRFCILTWLWSNAEDGVEGAPFWHERTASWSSWYRAFYWTALRNPLNNIRYVPLLNPRINPDRIRWVGNLDINNAAADSPGDEFAADELLSPQPRNVYWCFVWQFPYAGFWLIRRLDDATHRRYRIGWKLLPKDRFGVPPIDYRYIRCGFAYQWTPNRNG